MFILEQTPETPCMASVQQPYTQENECEHRLMTINEIINGSVNTHPLKTLNIHVNVLSVE